MEGQTTAIPAVQAGMTQPSSGISALAMKINRHELLRITEAWNFLRTHSQDGKGQVPGMTLEEQFIHSDCVKRGCYRWQAKPKVTEDASAFSTSKCAPRRTPMRLSGGNQQRFTASRAAGSANVNSFGKPHHGAVWISNRQQDLAILRTSGSHIEQHLPRRTWPN